MPNYTKIPKEFIDSYRKKLEGLKTEDIPKLASENPVVFAKYYLGKKLRLHQAYIMLRIVECWNSGKRRMAMCLARQLGKSIMLGIFLIWAAFYNKFPATILNVTTIYLVSRDDEAAVELLDKMRGILFDADRHMQQFAEQDDFFRSSLKEPNNVHQLTFANGCFIKSIPPTGAVLGKSASIIVIDEAHRLNCDDPDKFFNQFVVPTVAETGGLVILSSSPEGIIGFFYDAIDPDMKKHDNQYDVIWFSHSIWDDGSDACIRYKDFVEKERTRLTEEGKLKYWQQEYEAMFTVTQTSFFDSEDINNSLSDFPEQYEWHQTPCSVAYDFGIQTSRTVITIRTMISAEIIQLFQFRAPAGFDNNLLVDEKWEHSFQRLMQRYSLFMCIVDDSPPGNTTVRWFETDASVPLNKYNFRSDQMRVEDRITRNSVAYSYKARLKQSVLKIPAWNTVQQLEMKTVQEVVQKVFISIKAPEGHLCDTFDSDMMACIPFLKMEQPMDFKVDYIEPEEKKSRGWDGRKDPDAFKPLTDEEMRELAKSRSLGNVEDIEFDSR